MQNPFKIFFQCGEETETERSEEEQSSVFGGHVPAVDEKRIAEWNGILRRYKNARGTVERKIKSNEKFWRMRQWKEGFGDGSTQPIPSTAWLFTCIQSKLADVMEAYPTVNLRPRQRDDTEEARRLSGILPVIVAQNNFEQTYRNVSEYTLKNGVGVYHVWWDGSKHGGLGDIAITETNVLDIFWEPGITDLQRSAYVFTVETVDAELLKRKYPTVKISERKTVSPERFLTDERVDMSGKAAVVDVYYKLGGVLHYAKYVGETCLEATENDPERFPNGLYDHGMYPFVVQQLYHIEQSLYGTGLVDIAADTQLQIDLMNEAVVENTLMGAKPRYFSQIDNNINEADMLDWRKTLVKCNSVSETNLKQIDSRALSGNYLEFLNMKTEELKYVTSNLDVSNGAAPSGITAASAIAALQEASGKSSRAINKSFYNTFSQVMALVVELIRQFYDAKRCFRIAPDALGNDCFTEYDNSYLKGVPQSAVNGMDMGLRAPEFDLEITAEKANPYKRMEMNELALSFFKLGFFNPQLSDQALACLDMMDFTGKERIMEKIGLNGSLLEQMTKYRALCMAMAQKYGDYDALQLAVGTGEQGQNGAAVTNAGGVDPAEAADPRGMTGEAKQVERARARARSSTEVP